MIKIAIPTKDTDKVDDHFGHCEAYTVISIDQNRIKDSEILPSPQGCGCKSNIASVLKDKGVSVLLAGNMGQGALNVLNNHGIEVVRGCTGNINELVDSFISGQIKDSGFGCNSHGCND